MEEALLQLLKIIKDQKENEAQLKNEKAALLDVQIAPKSSARGKRSYVVRATDKFDERIAKATRATELRHLLARVKSMESSLKGIEKFQAESSSDDYSFGGRFDPMIQRVRAEIEKVQAIIKSYGAAPETAHVAATAPINENVSAESVSVPTEENKVAEAQSEVRELEKSIEMLQEAQKDSILSDGVSMEPEETIPVPAQPTQAKVQFPPTYDEGMRLDEVNKPRPEKRRQDFEELPRSDVLYSPSTGAVHQNTKVRPVTPVPESPKPIELKVTQQAVRVGSTLASSFRDHLTRR